MLNFYGDVTLQLYYDEMGSYIQSYGAVIIPETAVDYVFNLKPLIAYQQICSQFFTNSLIDDVFTAKDYVDTIFTLERDSSANQPFTELAKIYQREFSGIQEYSEYGTSFTLNGVRYEYDAYSGYYISNVFGFLANNEFMSNQGDADYNARLLLNIAAYVNSLFGYNRSLRYTDYFVSGRTRPYSVGDAQIDVADGVTALEINKVEWIQRLRQAVNRIPRNIYEYLRQMTGVEPAKTLPQPNYIATEHYFINGERVENTADEQGNIVSLLHSSGGSMMYEYMVDEPSYSIGVLSFVTDNFYPQASEKHHFIKDRLEWFNHFMQNVGEESVQAFELYKPKDGNMYLDNPVAYQQRYAAFKYPVNRVSGGFLRSQLRSWLVTRDFSLLESYDGRPPVLGSEFIRNSNVDFDVLFSSLSGMCPSDYYHFIIAYRNSDEVNSRQKVFAGLDD